MSSSIPSWQGLTAHAQPFREVRNLAFRLKVPLDSLLVWASCRGSGETARMRRLAWTFAARIGDKYQIRLTRSKWYINLKYCVGRPCWHQSWILFETDCSGQIYRPLFIININLKCVDRSQLLDFSCSEHTTYYTTITTCTTICFIYYYYVYNNNNNNYYYYYYIYYSNYYY